MKKQLLIQALVLTAVLVTSVFQLRAYDFVKDGIYYTVSGTNATVANNGSFNTYSGNIIIPATVTNNGTTYNVVTIGYQSFKDCSGLTGISLPEGIVYVMNEAFMNCTSLQSITLPSTVVSIYQNVFVGCSALESIICNWSNARSTNANNFDADTYDNATLFVPKGSLSSYKSTVPWSKFANVQEMNRFVSNGIYYNITSGSTVEVTFKDTNYNYYSGTVNIPSTVTFGGVTYTVTGIGRFAFRESPALTSVTIPSTVNTIGYASFYKATALTSLAVPNSVDSIGDQAFRETGLVNITLGNHVRTIGYGCFYRSESLESITFPNSVTTLGNLCFFGCTGLKSATIGSGITELPYECFTMCSALNTINFPATLKTIGNFALAYTDISSFSPSNGLETIGYGALQGCSSLASINLPASVYSIDRCAFDECDNLEHITVNSSSPYFMASYDMLFDKNRTQFIRYAPLKPTPYCSIPSTVTTIWTGAFADAQYLERVRIPASVTTIENSAFSNCQALTDFFVDEEYANFMSDNGVLYAKDTGVAHKLIQYPCGRPDKHYSILNTTDTIAASAFSYCTRLQSVYIPKSVKSMANATFNTATNLKRVVIDEGLTEVPDYAFYNCEELQSVYLPSTIKTIGQQAFAYTICLEDLTIAVEGNAPEIGQNAFYGIGAYTPDETVNVYLPSGMSYKYTGCDEWLDQVAVYTEISPIATGTTFTADSLNYEVTDTRLNATLTGEAYKLLDPGIPPKVAYQGNLCTVNALKDHAFAYDHTMVRAEVPFTVQKIDSYCFYDCRNIEKFTMHEGLKQINSYAISHINQLPRVTIPASADSVNGDAFTYDPALQYIMVKADNPKYTSVNGILFSKDRTRLLAFADGHGTEYTVPDGTQAIGPEAFRGATALTSVTMPKSLQQIGRYAFFDCSSLSGMNVPYGVTSIGNYAFGSCSALESADLPSTLTELGYNAFYNVPDLATLTVRATTPPTCNIYTNPRTGETSEPFIDSHYSNVQLIVPSGCAQAYRAANVWKKFQNITEATFPADALRGDVNNDGRVSIDDVTALIDYLLGSTGNISVQAADADLDNRVSIDDVTALIDYLLSGRWPATGIDLWYLMGDRVGNNPWENFGTGSIGRGLIPLYPTGEFDRYGQGQLIYVGYFGADDAVMLIHYPGSRDDCWGYTPLGIFGRGGEEITPIKTGQDGYFNVMYNTQTNRFYFYPYGLTTPITFNTINIAGDFNDWVVSNNSYSMTALNGEKENHNWVFKDFTIDNDSDLKFTANNEWEYNWGDDTFPFGHGQRDGMNIPVKAGTYDIYFNDITGDYNFIKK
ncbi:MAG: leucine-rich repeat protein [Muribaculaceae bacterium]|nr:leucine-rich repeat protein [Muribaculaceae bacterium]